MKAPVALQPEVVAAPTDRLGECPVWDDRAKVLWRVDAVGGVVIALHVGTGIERRYDVGRHVGSLVLRDDSDDVLLAAAGGFYALDVTTGHVSLLAPVHEDDPCLVMNDGACDPAGRFIAGTMRRDAQEGGAALYRYAPPGNAVTLLNEAGLSNGLCWDTSGTTLFWIDSLLGRVERLGYDPTHGVITSRETAFDLSSWGGLPDGMTIDMEGCLWIAFWRGGAVRRFDPHGRRLAEVSLPVLRTTSCCLGGDELRDLYVTTARRSLREVPDEVEPLAGAVFRVPVDVPGVPVPRWRADD